MILPRFSLLDIALVTKLLLPGAGRGFFRPKNTKKRKDVGEKHKKTVRCMLKTIKNSEKRANLSRRG